MGRVAVNEGFDGDLGLLGFRRHVELKLGGVVDELGFFSHGRRAQAQKQGEQYAYHAMHHLSASVECLEIRLAGLDSILEILQDHRVQIGSGIDQALGQQRADFVTGGGGAVEGRGGVVSVLLLQTDLGGQGSNVVAAVGVGQELSVHRMLGNALQDGHIAGSHGELSLELDVGGQELHEQPGGSHFLRIGLLEEGQAGALRDDLLVVRVGLGDGGDAHLEGTGAVSALRGALMHSAGGGADGHVALHAVGRNEQAGSVTAEELLGGQVAQVIPLAEALHESAVFLGVEQEVGRSGAGVGRLQLLAHGNEPVGLRVIAQGDGGGVNSDDLLEGLFQLVPGGGHGDVVGLEEGLVVVQHFGGLGQGQGVHQAIAELLALVVVALDEVSLLLGGQAHDLGGAVSTGDGGSAVDVAVQGLHRTGQVVQGNVVRIAVSDVGLGAEGDVGSDLIADVVVAADVALLDLDVGVQRVELSDVIVQNRLQIGAHGVVEGDGHLAAVIGGDFFGAGDETGHAGHQHDERQEGGEELLHVCFLPSYLVGKLLCKRRISVL